MITYKDTREFGGQLAPLFLSVNWSSGNYPEKLEAAMRGFGSVFSAWDGETLVGLVAVMDDGVMTAYVHYMLVRPEYQGKGVGAALMEKVRAHYAGYLRVVLIAYDAEAGFYERCGFEPSPGKTVMQVTSLWT